MENIPNVTLIINGKIVSDGRMIPIKEVQEIVAAADELIFYNTSLIGREPYRKITERYRSEENQYKPNFGDKCVFWNDIYQEDQRPFIGLHDRSTRHYQHYAALESLDEIGKPISYFKSRGRWV